MKKIKRSTAIFLSLIMIFYCLPIGSFAKAESISNEAVAETPTEAVEEWHIIDEQEIITDEMIGAVSEITSLREENVKHFRLSDGTYEAVVYSQPVHRKDQNNVWKDIDNTIELTTDVNVSKYSTQNSRVTFADRSTNNADLFTLSENGYSVSMKLLSAENEFNNELGTTDLGVLSTPTVNNSSVKRRLNVFNSIDEAKNIDNSSSIMYNNVRENTNIEYVLTGNDIKENIIINAPCESYQYVFQITLDGLCAYLNDKGEILLNDRETQKTKYVIPAPYMYDANGIYSYDVSYTLEQVKDEIYLLVINADEEWINSEDRAFPVVIDPTLEYYTMYYDSYIDANDREGDFGYDPIMWVSNTRTAYIKLDLPDLPSGMTVISAFLNVPYYYNISTGKLYARAYNVLSDWNEDSLKYNNAPALGSRISSTTLSASTSITQSSPGNARFTMTTAVNEWYSGMPNYGIAIKREESSTATNQSVILKSYEAHAEPTYITINYTYHVPDGVYALQLFFDDTEWMTVEDDICWSGVNVQHEYSTSSPTSSSVFDRSRLFKITRVGTTAKYTIRSMLNNNISFNIVNNKIVTKEIPSVDIEVPYADTFLIEWQGDGFTITPNGSSYAISMSYSSDDLYPELKANASTWDLVQYTGTHREGIQLLSNVTQFVVDKTITLKPAVWSTESGYNMPLLLIPSIYSSAASIVWDDDTRTGVASFFEVQQIRIDWRIRNEAANDAYGDIIYRQIMPIDEGVYYLQNAQTQYYVIENSPNPTEGVTVTQDEYNDSDYQQWELAYTSTTSLYVTLRSTLNGMYIGVDSDDTTKIVQYAQVNNYTKWKLEKTQKGNFKFTCKAFENNDSVLTATNDTVLTMSTYVGNDYEDACDYDEWYLVKKVISYVNYYDSSLVGNSTLIQNITLANSFANLVYSRYYNIGLFMDGSASRYVSTVESCTTGDGFQCSDVCGTDCNTSHHKNGKVMSDQIYNSPRESDHLYVLWTNRNYGTYCTEINGVHTEFNTIASVNGKRPVIIFRNISGSSNVQLASMTLNLVHETAHTFNMDEPYEDDDEHDVSNATQCVMERFEQNSAYDFYQDILNGVRKPFCDSCNEAMNGYTSNIIILGN